MPNEISSLEDAAYSSMADGFSAAQDYTTNAVRNPAWVSPFLVSTEPGMVNAQDYEGIINYLIPTTGAVRARSSQVWEPPVDSSEGLTLEMLQQARAALNRNMVEPNYSSYSTDIRIRKDNLTRDIFPDLKTQNYIARVMYGETILWEGSYPTKKEAQKNVESEYLKIYRSI
mgnify:CR=1 FL=1